MAKARSLSRNSLMYIRLAWLPSALSATDSQLPFDPRLQNRIGDTRLCLIMESVVIETHTPGECPRNPTTHSPGVQVDALRGTLADLLWFCRANHWAGWDPFDGLNSPLFRNPLLQNRYCRLAFIQFLKRCPLNLRPCFAVPRGVNPKGIALFLSATVKMQGCGMATTDEVRSLAELLISLRSPGWLRCCWGYHFDWQTRTYLVPRGCPNIICTTFAAEALLDAYRSVGHSRFLELAIDAGWFLLEALKRVEAHYGFCFSYTPLRASRVHNASLLGAALLARLFSFTTIPEFRAAAEAVASYAIQHQHADGSWLYGEDPNQDWIDSFHTGFNLLALESVAEHLGFEAAADSLRRGFSFYLDHFFAADGVVKYFHNRSYPIDTHALAHAIITLVSLRRLDSRNLKLAREVCGWSLRYMRSPEGWFYYQKWRLWTNRINYIRWSQAWMLLALATLAEALASNSGDEPHPKADEVCSA